MADASHVGHEDPTGSHIRLADTRKRIDTIAPIGPSAVDLARDRFSATITGGRYPNDDDLAACREALARIEMAQPEAAHEWARQLADSLSDHTD